MGYNNKTGTLANLGIRYCCVDNGIKFLGIHLAFTLYLQKVIKVINLLWRINILWRITMKKYFIILFCIIMCFSACVKTQPKEINTAQGVQNKQDNEITILPTNEKAVINSDCDYFIYYSDTPSGKLTKGQNVIILDYYYSRLHDGNIDIYVEVETLDKTVKGRVIETYISYSKPLHNLWFKNIPLTRSYYYTESVEYIYKKEFLPMTDEDVDEEDTIKMMRWFFSPRMMLISERYLFIGNGEYGSVFRIISVDEKNKNTYVLKLFNLFPKGVSPEGEFEIVLHVEDDSITITQIINENKIYLDALGEYDLNIKYIPYNREKSEKIEKDILAWCFEQLKILGAKSDKL